MTAPLIEMVGAVKRFDVKPDLAQRLARRLGARAAPSVVHAVDHVDLAVERGAVAGLVGESGCGKSTLARLVAGLYTLTSGKRLFEGRDLAGLEAAERKRIALRIQMIFQDPYASLNPRMRVTDIVGEAPVVHGQVAQADQRDFVAALLGKVGLDGALQRRFAHQFSGGQRARIGIARALAVAPELLVCDEALAALDVSIQAQVLNLFIRLKDELNLTYLFISHDLAVVRHLADRIFIMYLGRIVESAPTAELFAAPNHPYTRALLAEAPTLEVRKKTFVAVQGELPSPLAPPSGCHFHPRCPHVMERCRHEAPRLETIAPGRTAACHLNDVR